MGKRVRRDWSAVVEAQAASGLSVGAYCAQEQINRGLFYRWRRILGGRAAAPQRGSFVELQGTADASSGSGVTLVSAHGWRVEVAPDFDVSTLQRVCVCVERALACSR
jgi:hypothetical protein